MKLKKLFSFAAVGMLSLSLAACGSSDSTTETPEQEEPQATEAVSDSVTEVEAGNKEFTLTATNFDLVSDKELVVKKGDSVVIHVENKEGVHGIEIKEFGVSGGVGESIEFVATETGTFDILCSIACGAGHNDMKVALTVVE